MSTVTRFFDLWLSLGRRPRNRDCIDGIADGTPHMREPPIVLAEVIAASSFVDLGGIPDARLFHTLYDWRLSEAGRSSNDAPSKRGRCNGIPLTGVQQ
jgi:hypothetical protein